MVLPSREKKARAAIEWLQRHYPNQYDARDLSEVYKAGSGLNYAPTLKWCEEQLMAALQDGVMTSYRPLVPKDVPEHVKRQLRLSRDGDRQGGVLEE